MIQIISENDLKIAVDWKPNVNQQCDVNRERKQMHPPESQEVNVAYLGDPKLGQVEGLREEKSRRSLEAPFPTNTRREDTALFQ